MTTAALPRKASSDRMFAILLFTGAAVAAGALVINSLPGRGSQLAADVAVLDSAPASSGQGGAAAAPSPFPSIRYAQMSAKSPFAIATQTAPVAAPTPGFAANLYVAGVARVGLLAYVAIKSRTDPDKSMIFLEVGGKPSADGVKAERLDWSDEMGKSKVFVSKAGDTAILAFDQDAIQKAGSAAAANNPPGFPGPGRPILMPGGRPIPILPANGANPAFYRRPRVFGPGTAPDASGVTPAQMHRRTAVIPAGQ